MKPRVFILEPNDLPLRNASAFGQVTYMFEGQDRPSIWSPDFVPHMMDVLHDAAYDPKIDYFCVVGHQVPVVMAISSICVEYGCIKMLVFNSIERMYAERPINKSVCVG